MADKSVHPYSTAKPCTSLPKHQTNTHTGTHTKLWLYHYITHAIEDWARGGERWVERERQKQREWGMLNNSTFCRGPIAVLWQDCRGNTKQMVTCFGSWSSKASHVFDSCGSVTWQCHFWIILYGRSKRQGGRAAAQPDLLVCVYSGFAGGSPETGHMALCFWRNFMFILEVFHYVFCRTPNNTNEYNGVLTIFVDPLNTWR